VDTYLGLETFVCIDVSGFQIFRVEDGDSIGLLAHVIGDILQNGVIVVLAVHVLALYFLEYTSGQNFVDFLIKRVHLLGLLQVELLKHIILDSVFQEIELNLVSDLAIGDSSVGVYLVFAYPLVFWVLLLLGVFEIIAHNPFGVQPLQG